MNYITIKQSTGDVSIEYEWEISTDDVTIIQGVGYNRESKVVDILDEDVPQNVYDAFCAMTEHLA